MSAKCTKAISRVVLGIVCLPVAAQTELKSLRPSTVVALDGGSLPVPFMSAFSYDKKPTLQFRTEAYVTYKIPAGNKSFSGVLIFNPTPVVVSPDLDTGDRILLSIYVDQQLVLNAVMDQASPPLSFSIPVAGAGSLTIKALDFFPFNTFHLADAIFSQEPASGLDINLPSSGGGSVVFADPAEALLQKFVPGSIAKFTAVYAGADANGNVTINTRPEHGHGAPQRVVIPILLAMNGQGVAVATGAWTVPQIFGPTLLEISLNVGGRQIWTRVIRAALSPQINLSDFTNSSFGVHISGSSYLRADDEFAYLWNAKWARIFLQWDAIERTPDHYDFSAIDEVVNIYRAQNIRILMTIGESWPAWTEGSGQKFQEAWSRFVQQVVERYQYKVDAWEPFNEIDAKWGLMRQKDPNWDIEVLKSAITMIRKDDPNKPIVCCSSATGIELDYQNRLLQHGIFAMVDDLALHPYETTAPEDKEGVADLLGRVADLRNLEQSAILNKQIWCTEAQWIMGKPGERYVTAANIDDHTQAEYVTRANLLAMTESRYFLHAPFHYGSHRLEHVDTLAAYSFMASVFSDEKNSHVLLSDPDVYGVTALTPQGVAGALWTRTDSSTVSLTGLAGVRFFDMYGNAQREQAAQLTLGQEPIYFIAESGTPSVSITREPPPRSYAALPPAASWVVRRSGEQAQSNPTGVLVQTPVEQYGYDLESPPFTVIPNACYVAQFTIKLYQGSLMLSVLDADSHAQLGVNYISFKGGDNEPPAEIRFLTGNSTTRVNLIVGTANVPDAASSKFQTSSAIRIAPCRNGE